MDQIFLPKPVSRYISRIVAATHADADEAMDEVRSYVSYGASPRAAIAMAEAARAYAMLAGRPTVGFEDVKAVADMESACLPDAFEQGVFRAGHPHLTAIFETLEQSGAAGGIEVGGDFVQQ